MSNITPPTTRLLTEALYHYGTSEWAGARRNNPLIVHWLKQILPWSWQDETPWCSAFMFACATMAKVDRPDANEAPAAASWRTVGEERPLYKCDPGDIVVLYRGSKTSWQRHVGVYIRQSKTHVYVLGGNQGNRVQISAYPIEDIDVCRRPGSRL